MRLKTFTPYILETRVMWCRLFYRENPEYWLLRLFLVCQCIAYRKTWIAPVSGLWIVVGIFCLVFTSRRLRANWLVRWMVLAQLVWLIGAIPLTVKSFLLTPTSFVYVLVQTLLTLSGFVIPSLFLSAGVTALFPCKTSFTVHQNAFGAIR